MADPLPRLPLPEGLVLHRFTVRPRHWDAWLELWPDWARAWDKAGFDVERLFVETDAEPKVTLLATRRHRDAAVPPVDPRAVDHVFRNAVTRDVRGELLTHATPESIEGRIAIMRRYAIVGGWPEFLSIWERIVEVREAYGFRCLFAVADEPHDLFTWAFDFAGEWSEFAGAQREYYRDPARVALRDVFHHMADYSIHPARQLLV